MSLDDGAVLVSGARTPVGKLLGSLSSCSAVDLGAVAVRAALERAGLPGDRVEYVVMGQVLQAGCGQVPARQAAVAAGVPMDVPAVTLNKACLSGLSAVALADQLIRAGEAEIVVAGGMESMSGAPHLLPKVRRGFRFGNATVVDALIDGLEDAFDHLVMGESTERHTAGRGLTREDQDAFAAASHQRAAAATKDGVFDEEIVPVTVSHGRGEPAVVRVDEGIRADTSVDVLRGLAPAFTADGAITAGNSSQLSDGACAVVVASRAAVKRLDLPVLAEIGASGNVAGSDNSLLSQPSRAIARALQRESLNVSDLDVIEINEAFAAVVLQSMRDLELSSERVNVNGGAIALGHPVGMSGTRLVLHLALELARRGGGVGAAGLCGGGGQGEALLLRA